MEVGKVNYGLVGMLWFDNSQVDSFATRLARAVNYYRQKEGRQVTMVEAPVSEIPETRMVGDVLVIPLGIVLPHHMILFSCELDEGSKNVENVPAGAYQEALF
jgi:hypothetical protein